MKPRDPAIIREEFQHKYPGGKPTLLPEIAHIGWSKYNQAVPSGLNEHLHENSYEICYIIHGRVDWWVEDEIFEVGPGEIYITKPDERHGGVDDALHPCELYWLQVYLDPQDKSRPLATQDPKSFAALVKGFAAMDMRVFPGSPSFMTHAERILTEHRNPNPFSAAASRASLALLLFDVLRDYKTHRARIDARTVARSPEMTLAMAWIDEHLAEPFSMEETAEAVGLSPSQFRHRFGRETGFSPVEYATQQRLRLAKRLLRSGRLSVTQIAHRLGFASSQYFATVFRKYTGVAPSDYLRRQS